jgi:hypothetical protein
MTFRQCAAPRLDNLFVWHKIQVNSQYIRHGSKSSVHPATDPALAPVNLACLRESINAS